MDHKQAKQKKTTKVQQSRRKKIKTKPRKPTMDRSISRVHSLPAAKSRTTVNNAIRSMRVRHRERVALLSGNSGAATYVWLGDSNSIPGYDINPANPVLFPWLSHVAEGFEKYAFRSLKVQLIPSNPTSVSGRVLVAMDYDWDDEVPNLTTTVGQAQITGMYGTKTCDVWTPLTYEVDVARMNMDHSVRYCSKLVAPNAVEPRTAFAGFFMIALGGSSATCTFEMWVDYEVDLFIPQYVVDDGTGEQAGTTALPMTVGGVVAFPPITTNRGLPLVTQGANGVPLFSAFPFTADGRVPSNATILDTGRILHGHVTALARMQTLVAAPNVTAPGPYLNAAFFDSAGQYLGDSQSSTLLSNTANFSAEKVTEWTMAARNIVGRIELAISDCKSLYALFRYVLLYAGVGNAIAGEATSNIQWRKVMVTE